SLHATLGTDTIQDLTYSHYENGQVFERTTPDKIEEFNYDGLGRLSAVLTNDGLPPSVYDYDVYGNIKHHGATASTYQTQFPQQVDQVTTSTTNVNTYS